MIITVPKPCSQNWDDMAGAGNGRHCSACAKTVIDFTLLTDAEVVTVMQAAAGAKICGRYNTWQLGRELAPARHIPGVPFVQQIAATLLLLQATAAATWAQSAKTPHAAQEHSLQRDSSVSAMKVHLQEYKRKPIPTISSDYAHITTGEPAVVPPTAAPPTDHKKKKWPGRRKHNE